MIYPLWKPANFMADGTFCNRVVGMTCDPLDFPVLNINQEAAGVRTIEGTDRSYTSHSTFPHFQNN
ncbi:hypothetical protein GCM10025857_01600 [Alicyclobacillus contaminans]|nr:hypothetical protein GCM10025857_01600 [Alicyclobacillus contaminans]